MSNPYEPPPPTPRGSIGPILIALGIAVTILLGGGIAVAVVVGSGPAAEPIVIAGSSGPASGQPDLVAPASTQPPSGATQELASAEPESFSDPACDTGHLARVLYGVEEEFKQGALDLKGTAELDRVDVGVWWLDLSRVEEAAGLDVYKATVAAKGSLKSFIDTPKGSAISRVMAFAMQGAMAKLAQSCGIDLAYTFADAYRVEASPVG